MQACTYMHVFLHLRTHIHMYICMYAERTYVHANTHMHQLKSQQRACQTKAAQQGSVCQTCRPVQKNRTQNFFRCRKQETHTHAHTHKHV
jgi:hypothetical protein